jgi:N-acetylmuramoyl-L-alanine amidase
VWEYKAGNYFKYTAGKAQSLNEAAQLQTQVRAKGYKDAFIVAFKNGERVDVNEAVKLLKK